MAKRPSPRRSRSGYDERIRRLQSQLGLRPDGILGPATLSSLEQRVGLAAADTGTLVASRQGLDLLVSFEISSPAYYRQRLSYPAWPGVESGVTIGIGYDLGMSKAADARGDWSPHLDSATLERLMTAVGITGSRAKTLVASITDITIALEAAESVFYSRSLPLAAEVDAMVRLWPDTKGLRDRRIAEAALIRAADHPYEASDLISI